MRSTRLLFALLALAGSTAASADAFKCKTPEGQIVITSTPCPGGSRTEAVEASEPVPEDRRQQAERDLERQRKGLAERDAARAAERKREDETQRRLAEEESARKTQCLRNAEREADPQYRAALIAACSGTAPQEPAVVQQPVLVPSVLAPSRQRRGAIGPCSGGDCDPPPVVVQPPATGGNPNAPIAPGRRTCQRGADGVLRCF